MRKSILSAAVALLAIGATAGAQQGRSLLMLT